jgi:hypothetical protein
VKCVPLFAIFSPNAGKHADHLPDDGAFVIYYANYALLRPVSSSI